MKRRDFVQQSLWAAAAVGIAEFRAVHATARPGSVADVAAVTGDGREITLRGKDLQDLAAKLHGQLLLAGDGGYDDARHILNPSFDKHPALIVQPASARRAATRSTWGTLTTPFLCLDGRVVLTPTSSSSGRSIVGSRSLPNAAQYPA